MIKLLKYIDEIGVNELAGQLGVTRAAVAHWQSGIRRPSPTMAYRIEMLTRKKIRRQDIRPDIFGGMS